ncbi:MAG: copper resistance protein B, partial [Candidatus Binataceae bacterium]
MNARKYLAPRFARLLVGVIAVASAFPAFTQDATRGMGVSPMQDVDRGAVQPSQPAEMKRLDDGQMIGVRPVSDGLETGGGEPTGGMQMSSMQGMHISSMQGGNAPPNARSPDYSDGYGAGPMCGMDMRDNAPYGMLLLDQFEYADGNHGKHGNAEFIDGEAYYGTDLHKLWLKAEGQRGGGKLQDLRTEVLWDHAYDTYFSTQFGVRHDLG